MSFIPPTFPSMQLSLFFIQISHPVMIKWNDLQPIVKSLYRRLFFFIVESLLFVCLVRSHSIFNFACFIGSYSVINVWRGSSISKKYKEYSSKFNCFLYSFRLRFGKENSFNKHFILKNKNCLQTSLMLNQI